MSTNETLNAWGNRYGDFETHAEVTQTIKRVMCSAPKGASLSDDKNLTELEN